MRRAGLPSPLSISGAEGYAAPAGSAAAVASASSQKPPKAPPPLLLDDTCTTFDGRSCGARASAASTSALSMTSASRRGAT